MTHAQAAWPRAEELERYLGDPLDPAARISFARTAAWDRDEAWPEEALRELSAWGFDAELVPALFGGTLDLEAPESLVDRFQLLRVLARRDLSVHRLQLDRSRAVMPVWFGGREEEKARAARAILGGEMIACAEGALAAAPDRLSLAGTARFVAGAARTRSIMVRADDGLVCWLELDPRRVSPRVRTVGLRSVELSNVDLAGCARDPTSVIRSERASFIADALALSGPLGAADTALRCALSFALARRLYQGDVFSIPLVRHTLAGAFADLLVADAVALHAVRAPDAAALARAFVEPTIDRLFRDVAVVLGARHYLAEDHWFGVFEKMLRDRMMIAIEPEPSPGVEAHEVPRFAAACAESAIASLPADHPLATPPWLELGRARLLDRRADASSHAEALAETLMDLHRKGRLFSLASFALASGLPY